MLQRNGEEEIEQNYCCLKCAVKKGQMSAWKKLSRIINCEHFLFGKEILLHSQQHLNPGLCIFRIAMNKVNSSELYNRQRVKAKMYIKYPELERTEKTRLGNSLLPFN